MGKDQKRWSTGWTRVGFYFRNVTELLLFGIRGDKNRTLAPGRSQVNLLRAMKREHSRKPDEFVNLIEDCSPGPYLEMFARGNRTGWDMWGNQAVDSYEPDWNTYSYHTIAANSSSGIPLTPMIFEESETDIPVMQLK